MWGSHNSLEHDLSGLETFARENLSKDQRIAYEARGANWFVLSVLKWRATPDDDEHYVSAIAL